ncbi:MAG: TRZ/ATZ family hydrolase [Burkholderiaceae bacterium]|nr:TRZ/ATZ family hydrolase [Burkholderiaceae bacterium]
MHPAAPEQLIRPRWIAPVTDGSPVLAEHAVLVRDGAIAAVGPAAELAHAHPAATAVELPGHLLVPGFVNAHCHAAMTLLRGAGDDLPLESWLAERIWPLERALVSDAFVHDGTVLACREMLLGGVTCFSDMYFFPEAVGRAALAMRMRAVLGIVVFDFPSPYGAGPGDYLSKGLALRDELRDQARLSFSLSPHAPYTNSDETLRRIASLAAELQLPVATHLHETEREVKESLALHGERPIARLERLGLLGPEFIAIHAVHMSDEDIARLARAGASLVTCPHSNLKLASGIARVGAMARAGINVAVGTDGAASNNRLDVLAESRLAALLAKAETGDAAVFDAHQALHALTRAGAQALGLADRIGSIEPGKRADLVALDLSAPEYGPVLDPVATLVHAAGREAVTDVWIDGERVVTERQIANSLSREAVGTVVRGSPLWHNRLGEFVSGRAV